MGRLIEIVDQESLPGKDCNNVLAYQHQGYMIYVGRNALSNEKLIAEHPHRHCLWMHALAARGSHVILCIGERKDVEDAVIDYASQLALEHSHSEGRTVRISRLEKVFKPEGGGVGVWRTTQTTTHEVPLAQ